MSDERHLRYEDVPDLYFFLRLVHFRSHIDGCSSFDEYVSLVNWLVSIIEHDHLVTEDDKSRRFKDVPEKCAASSIEIYLSPETALFS